jgi:hypothetical protein
MNVMVSGWQRARVTATRWMAALILVVAAAVEAVSVGSA